MKAISKYENLQTLLPNLQSVLYDSLQKEILDIKRVNFSCEKYVKACMNHKELENAEYVIYSPYITRENHKYEKFVFIDATGHTICHLSGEELELYDMMVPILELHESKEYIFHR